MAFILTAMMDGRGEFSKTGGNRAGLTGAAN
jgi:hypothetical protein